MMSTFQTNLVEAWVAKLTQHGYHVTMPRLAVIELLAQNQRALAAEQLFDLALHQDIRLGRATVYRTLDLLEKLRLVCRVSDGRRQYVYIRSDLAKQPLAICEQCGDLLVIQSHLFERLLVELYRQSNFEIHGHSLHLSGICQTCQP
ncbi:MAG: Fur family transcriptional regulator [Caldilineaceae bacterium]